MCTHSIINTHGKANQHGLLFSAALFCSMWAKVGANRGGHTECRMTAQEGFVLARSTGECALSGLRHSRWEREGKVEISEEFDGADEMLIDSFYVRFRTSHLLYSAALLENLLSKV